MRLERASQRHRGGWDFSGLAIATSPANTTCAGGRRSLRRRSPLPVRYCTMWQKPEFEVVDVTMEVTAYVARR